MQYQFICSSLRRVITLLQIAKLLRTKVESTQSPPDGIFTIYNTTSASKHQQAVMLKSAWTIASGGSRISIVSVCVLFDQGNKLSYITMRLKEQLRHKPVKIEILKLNKFSICLTCMPLQNTKV